MKVQGRLPLGANRLLEALVLLGWLGLSGVVFVIGMALADRQNEGVGVMASCAGGDLIARHITGAPLPDYATAFMLSRYQDPEYISHLDRWGDGGQL